MNQVTPGAEGAARPSSTNAFTPFRLAVLIGLATLAADQILSIANLRRTSEELSVAVKAQEQPLQQARRIEAQLDALATGSAQLAQAGNPRAQAIVAQLQARGVSIDPEARKRTN